MILLILTGVLLFFLFLGKEREPLGRLGLFHDCLNSKRYK